MSGTSGQAVVEDRKPLVLLVEDKPASLKRRRALFESYGCTAVAVTSASAALRELERTPLVDLVVTDIHMPPEHGGDEEDKSGLNLARAVRARFRDLPIAGYSAHFSEDDFGGKEWRTLFDVYFPKGRQTVESLGMQVETCIRLAFQRRDNRAAEVEERLTSLRRDYEATTTQIEVVRKLALDETAEPEAYVEGVLGRAGYRLRLVTARDGEPFVVWIHRDFTGTAVEVYRHPELYSFGVDEHEALGRLAELMELMHVEFQGKPIGARQAPPVVSLERFLRRVLSPVGTPPGE